MYEVETVNDKNSLNFKARLGRELDLRTREINVPELRAALKKNRDLGKEVGLAFDFRFSEDGNEIEGITLSERKNKREIDELVSINRNEWGQFEVEMDGRVIGREELVELRKNLAELLTITEEKKKASTGSPDKYRRMMLIALVVTIMATACAPAATPTATERPMTQPTATAIYRPTEVMTVTATPEKPSVLPVAGGVIADTEIPTATATLEPTPEATKDARYVDVKDSEGNVHHVRIITIDGKAEPFGLVKDKDLQTHVDWLTAPKGPEGFVGKTVSGFFSGEVKDFAMEGYQFGFYIQGADGKFIKIWVDTLMGTVNGGPQLVSWDESDPYALHKKINDPAPLHPFFKDLISGGMVKADTQAVLTLAFPKNKDVCSVYSGIGRGKASDDVVSRELSVCAGSAGLGTKNFPFVEGGIYFLFDAIYAHQ